MKFKGQGKINICGFEYKQNIADSRRGGGGVRAPKKNPVSAPAYADVNLKWRNEKGSPFYNRGSGFKMMHAHTKKTKYWRKCRFLCFLPRDHIGTQSLVTHADLTN